MTDGFTAFVIWAPILAPAVPMAANFLLLPCGVLWSPVGAAICGIIARKRGLSPQRYTALGALYSALFFFPWLYLVLRMLGRRVPHFIVVLFYAVVLLGWLVSIVVTAVGEFEIDWNPVPRTPLVIFALFSLVIWLISLVWLMMKTEKPRPNFPPDSVWRVSLPDKGFILSLLMGSANTGLALILVFS